jgi:hypothetical protein
MINFNDIIEKAAGPELAALKQAVSVLPQPLLADLTKEVMNYPDPHSETGDRRDLLEIATG